MIDPRLAAPIDALRVTLPEVSPAALVAAIGELEALKAQAWALMVAAPARSCAGPSESEHMTAAALAVIYNVPPSFFYEMARAGRLPRERLGRYVRFNRADVERMIAARRSPPSG